MKKYYIFLITALFVLGACNEVEIDEMDPNNFADATPDLLITGPMLSNALTVEGELARLANIFTNQFTGADRQYISFNSYNVTAGDFDNAWGTLYADGLAQCRLVREKAIEANEDALEGIAMIVEASLAGTALSLWGDVPYTEAADVETYPQPMFEAQTAVIDKLVTLLDAAIGKVGDATVADLEFGAETVDQTTRNNMVWSEVANSLKAKLLLIKGDYDGANTAAKLGISGSNADWLINHDDGDDWIDGKMNIYWNFCVWNRDGYMGAGDAYLPNLLTTRGDARKDYYYIDWWTSDGSLYPYVWYGGIFENYAPFPVITYYETQLIIAETELLDSSPTTALEALNNVRNYWDARLGDGDGATFPEFEESDFANDAELLTEILTEKYISMYGQIGAFDDMRRTDNYINIPLKAGETQMPERFVYPQSEINSNENVPAIESIFVPTKVNEGTYPGI
ncbi:MAG: SusD/RagB family nutrient-binding outer membrane lipoprotein [Carboxylicivirga sp.]|jgi:hypothetical protein|nr:SusD/RagB family nutrient-binding outer membrane lipoprotein [Carboxylicivirga sp.]